MKNLLACGFVILAFVFCFVPAPIRAQGGTAPFSMAEELKRPENQRALAEWVQQHCRIEEAREYDYIDKDGKPQIQKIDAKLSCISW